MANKSSSAFSHEERTISPEINSQHFNFNPRGAARFALRSLAFRGLLLPMHTTMADKLSSA
jgi:hypothetical protein